MNRDIEDLKIGSKIIILLILIWSGLMILIGAYTIAKWIIGGIY